MASIEPLPPNGIRLQGVLVESDAPNLIDALGGYDATAIAIHLDRVQLGLGGEEALRKAAQWAATNGRNLSLVVTPNLFATIRNTLGDTLGISDIADGVHHHQRGQSPI